MASTFFRPLYLCLTTHSDGYLTAEPLPQAARAHLAELVQAGGGAVPDCPGWVFRVQPVGGGALITVARENGGAVPTPVATAGVAYAPAGARRVWDHLRGLHLATYRFTTTALTDEGRAQLRLTPEWLQNPQPPAELPWLGDVLLPGLVFCNARCESWRMEFIHFVAEAVLDAGDAQGPSVAAPWAAFDSLMPTALTWMQ